MPEPTTAGVRGLTAVISEQGLTPTAWATLLVLVLFGAILAARIVWMKATARAAQDKAEADSAAAMHKAVLDQMLRQQESIVRDIRQGGANGEPSLVRIEQLAAEAKQIAISSASSAASAASAAASAAVAAQETAKSAAVIATDVAKSVVEIKARGERRDAVLAQMQEASDNRDRQQAEQSALLLSAVQQTAQNTSSLARLRCLTTGECDDWTGGGPVVPLTKVGA